MKLRIIKKSKKYIKKNYQKFKNIYIFASQIVLKRKSPSIIFIEPTNICNANCIFCAYQFYQAEKNKMDIKMLKKILDESKDLKIKTINLTPFAGEILTDKNILDKLKIIRSYNFKEVKTYTNLINLHKIDINDFLNSGITELHISAAPLERELFEKIFRVNAYKLFLNNLITLLDRFNKSKNKTVKKIFIEFRSPMKLEECIKLPDYVNNIKNLISKDITIGAMCTFDSWMGVIRKKDLLEGMKIAKPNGKKIIPCSRLNNIQILANGDMRGCGCRFNNQKMEDIFYLGNIKNTTIKSAYNSKKLIKTKESFFLKNPPVECQKCSWYS